MIDIEGLATGPDATILTIAAQCFDPLTRGYYKQHYYARVTLESQENRQIEQGTIDWWATQKDRKSTRLNSSHVRTSRMPSSA